MSIYATAFLGLVPLGSLFAGAMGNVLHPPYVIAGMSSIALAVFIYVYFANPRNANGDMNQKLSNPIALPLGDL